MSVSLNGLGNNILLYQGEVISVDDNQGGGRIKAKISTDKVVENVPYAFPLLPKILSITPKVGELVLILCSMQDPNSNRFYIGPIISQMQQLSKDEFHWGKGQADCMMKDSNRRPLTNIADCADTYGAFPKKEAVALLGRETEDIQMYDGRLLLRSGARVDISEENEDFKGKVGFDKENTAYFMLRKNEQGLPLKDVKDFDVNKSVAVLGADKFLFASKKNMNVQDVIGQYDTENMVNDEDLQALKNALHAVPFGDVLVRYLEHLKMAMLNHVHPWAGMPPCKANGIPQITEDDYNNMLSPNFHIS